MEKIELKLEHGFLISEIVDKMQVELPELPKERSTAAMQKWGLETMNEMLKKAYKAKEPLTKLLAELTGKSVDDIKKTPLKESVTLIMDLFKNEGFFDFFKQPVR